MRFEEADLLSGILSDRLAWVERELNSLTDKTSAVYQSQTLSRDALIAQLKSLKERFPELVVALPPDAVKGGTYQIRTVEHTTRHPDPVIVTDPPEGDGFVVRWVPVGVHVALTYEEGFINQIATRGTGYEGEDVMATAFKVPGLLLALPTLAHYQLVVHGIVGISEDNYLQLPEPRPSVRNYIAGLLRSNNADDPNISKLVFVAIDVFGYDLTLPNYTHAQTKLMELGFTITTGLERSPEYYSDGVSYTLDTLKEKRHALDSSTVTRYIQR